MENAVEAIKMAFAVIVFVMALTVSMFMLTQVKATSDVVLYTEDELNYYDYQGATGPGSENRIVGLETIIPTLYKYYKENNTVVFREGNYNAQTGQFSNLSYMKLYETPSNVNLWTSSYSTLVNDKYGEATIQTIRGNRQIFSFDLDEETLRHEAWTGSNDKIKNNLDCFLTGEVYDNPNNNEEYIDYGASKNVGVGGFIGQYGNSKFVETIGEYTYNSTQTEDSTVATSVKAKKKRIIIFTRIKNY